MRVLIVEDDPTTARVVQYMIRDYVDFEHAVNGQEGYDALCKAYDDKNPFDLVILDIMMPQVDGQEMLEAVREYEENIGVIQSDGVKVVMTTCVDDNHEIHRSLAAGVIDYLQKPVKREKLMNILHRVNGTELSKREASEATVD